jgi:alkylhydroperoxidase family enzyme
MPEIPYVPADVLEPVEIVSAIRARRGGTLLNLDRMLLHSPPFALGWNTLLGVVREKLSLSPRLRELAICAVGAINGADYEVFQHAGPFRASGGSDPQLAALSDCEAAVNNVALFDARERAILALTLAMTRTVKPTAETLAKARSQLASDRQLVELVGVVATYNMVSRFLVALGVEPE